MKLKKGDEVIINAGKDRGKKGKIEKIFPKTNMVFIPGVNIYKRHLKKRDEKNPGGIIDFSRPLPIANVSIVCSKCDKPTRVGYVLQQGKDKLRVCRKCNSSI